MTGKNVQTPEGGSKIYWNTCWAERWRKGKAITFVRFAYDGQNEGRGMCFALLGRAEGNVQNDNRKKKYEGALFCSEEQKNDNICTENFPLKLV